MNFWLGLVIFIAGTGFGAVGFYLCLLFLISIRRF
jgi:hypothetical protein